MKTPRVCRAPVLCTLFICLVSPPLAKSSGQYVLTVAGEKMQFVAQRASRLLAFLPGSFQVQYPSSIVWDNISNGQPAHRAVGLQ